MKETLKRLVAFDLMQLGTLCFTHIKCLD